MVNLGLTSVFLSYISCICTARALHILGLWFTTLGAKLLIRLISASNMLFMFVGTFNNILSSVGSFHLAVLRCIHIRKDKCIWVQISLKFKGCRNTPILCSTLQPLSHSFLSSPTDTLYKINSSLLYFIQKTVHEEELALIPVVQYVYRTI